MKYNTKQTWKIYFRHAWRFKKTMIASFLSFVVAQIFWTIQPYYFSKIIDAVVGGLGFEEAQFWLFLFIGAAIAGNMIFRLGLYLNSYFQTNVIAEIEKTCFAYVHNHSVTFFQNSFIGSLVRKVSRFGRSFEVIADTVYFNITGIVVSLSASLFVIFFVNPLITFIIIAWTVIYIILNYIFSKYKLPFDIERSEMDSKKTAYLADTLTNHENVKLYTKYKQENLGFGKAVGKHQKLQKFTWDLSTHFELLQSIFMIALEAGVLLLSIRLLNKGSITTGEFVLINTYLGFLFHKIWDIGRIIRNFYEAFADAEEMTEIFETPHEITDKADAKNLKVTEGKIELSKVDFHYNKTRSILRKFNLTINAKEKVAFVGPSGAGKSTVMKLLLRQHDVSAGKVLIDGQNIQNVSQESLWKNIGFVPQDPILFHRSLLENIRYGKPGATKKEIIAAARKAHCHEFISSLPEGYDTLVGERGVKLSGGERQRVAIARAMLKNAPILLLDEATSSLDSESEKYIQDALHKLMEDKTVIVIAHRLSTISEMDRILVIDDGKIVEEGDHASLTKKRGGLYKKLWGLQSGGFLK